MRSDFPKLLCERPRRGFTHSGHSLRYQARYPHHVYSNINHEIPEIIDGKPYYQFLEDDEDCRFYKEERFKNFEPLKYKKGGGKYLNENLGPLISFLINQKGRYWDDVYSEICKTIPKRGTVNLHIYQHLYGYIHIFRKDKEGRIYRIGLDGYGLSYPSERYYGRMRNTDIIIDKNGIIIPAYEYIEIENRWRKAEYEFSKLQTLLKNNLKGFYKEYIYPDRIEKFTYQDDHHHRRYVQKTVYTRIPADCFKITSEVVNREFKTEYENNRIVQVEIDLPDHNRYNIPIFDNEFIEKDGTKKPVLVFSKSYYGFHTIEYKGSHDSRLYPKDQVYIIKHAQARRSLKVKNPVAIWDHCRLTDKLDVEKVEEAFWDDYNSLSLEIENIKCEMEILHKRVVNE